MKKIPTDTCVNINTFPLYFLDIDIIQSVVSIFRTHPFDGFLFMTEDATYAYGEDICKWLSLQHDSKRPQKIDILNDKKIIQVESGHEFVAVLTDDGLVYLASGHPKWKTNNTFRLIPTGNDRFEMIACEGDKLLLLRQDGTVFAFEEKFWGHDDSELVTLVNIDLKNVKIIACGAAHSLALTNTNQIYSWGWNNKGQLGLGDTKDRTTPSLLSFPDGSINSPIKNIAAGLWHSLVLLEDGQIFGCGSGQRSINDDKQDAKVPTKIPIENVQSVACMNDLDISLALDQSSHYYAWGMTINCEFLPPRKLDNQPRSFCSASLEISFPAITFGLTPFVFEYDDPILKLFNNPDNYDVEFIVDNRSILACKCHLKKESEYDYRM